MVNSDLLIEELVDSDCYQELDQELDDNSVVLELVNHIKNIKKDKTVIVGLIGGAASGKSTMTDGIPGILKNSAVICTDDYVIGDRKFRRPIDKKNPVDKYDSDFLNKKVRAICNLQCGEQISVPTYEPITGLAISKGEGNFNRKVGKVDYLIVEGDFDLVDKTDYKIYFHVSDKIRLKNRIDRDTTKRNQTDVKELMENFEIRQKNQHSKHTLPVSKTADMLIVVSSNKIEKENKYTYRMYLKKDM